MDIRDEIQKVLIEFSEGEVWINKATDDILALFNVSGMFSAKQMEDAYRDGYENEHPNLWDFDIENYR